MAFKLGDKCKNCDVIITNNNAEYSGFNLRTFCHDCHLERSRKYRTIPGRVIKYNLKKRYGITQNEYDRKFNLQLGGCAICKQPCKTGRNLAVDHDHKTNMHRDLLCQRCNVVLGLVNDDELLLFDMMDYLKRHELKVVS